MPGSYVVGQCVDGDQLRTGDGFLSTKDRRFA